MGYARVDNGYLILQHVRVPRDAMLARHSRVEADGSFVSSSENPKAVYGVMLSVRVYLVEESSLALQHATTIATRYSCVRRQGGGGGGAGSPERLVLDYQMQQRRLFPLIAAAYGLHFAALECKEAYDTFTGTWDVSLLPALHSTSAAFKSFATSTAAAGIETCRLLCGGHGYSHASGLPALFAEFAPSQSYEGDNTVLLGQAARWMVKEMAAGAAGATMTAGRARYSALETFTVLAAYLREAGAAPAAASEPLDLLPASFASSSEALLSSLREAARVAIVRAAAALEQSVQSGVPTEIAWSEHCGLALTTAAHRHAAFGVCHAFATRLARSARALSPAAFAALEVVRDVHLLHAVDVEAVPSLLESGYLRSSHAHAVRERLAEQLRTMRRDAVALVDAFDMSDLELNSVLGCALPGLGR